jgi:hypothetical protein
MKFCYLLFLERTRFLNISLFFLALAFPAIGNSQVQLSFGSYFGGNNIDDPTDIVSDDQGNIYICGQTMSSDFPATLGAHQTQYGGDGDCFIIKLNASNDLVWATYLGGSGIDIIEKMRFYNGIIYFVGSTNSASGISTQGAFSETLNGEFDILIGAMDVYGNLLWSTYYGGDQYEVARDLDVSGLGVFVTGSTLSDQGFVTQGALDASLGGSQDGYLLVLGLDGQPAYCSYFGGEEVDNAAALELDLNGNIFISGGTQSTNSIATPNAHQPSIQGTLDLFLVKFNPDYSVNWGTYVGGNATEQLNDMVLAPDNGIVLLGETNSNEGIVYQPTFQNSIIGQSDMFIFQMTSNGSFVWSTYYGGEDAVYGRSLKFFQDNLFMSGNTSSDDLPLSNDAFRDSLYGATDLFLAVFDLNHAFAYGSYFGGNYYDFGPCMALTENGFYFAGSTTSFQDIATPDAFQPIYGGGNREAFIQVFSGITLNKENSYSQVNLFPNPAHSSFSIDASSLIESFRILSLTGDQVYCSPSCKSKNVRFDCSRLDKGCYLVEIQTEKEVSVSKVMVDN